jgi:predicted phosphodiesterase
MILAILGGVHGQAGALRAALHAVEEAGILSVVHTGDSVLGGPDPRGAMDLLATHRVPAVQGAEDRLVGHALRKQRRMARSLDDAARAAVTAAHEALTGSQVEALLARPHTRRLEIDGIRILVCHGLPGHPGEHLDADTPAALLERLRESSDADIVVCGGGPDFTARLVADTLFVAPGRVALDGGAAYAWVSTESTPWTAGVERVPLPAG